MIPQIVAPLPATARPAASGPFRHARRLPRLRHAGRAPGRRGDALLPQRLLPRPRARGHRALRLARGHGHPRPGLRARAPAARRSGSSRDVADLYELTRRRGSSSSTASPSSRPSSWWRAIEASKAQPLSLLLFGLGIRHVGKTVAQLLARRFGTLDALMEATAEADQRGARRRRRHRRGGGRASSPSRATSTLIERLQRGGLDFSEPRAASARRPAARQDLRAHGHAADAVARRRPPN